MLWWWGWCLAFEMVFEKGDISLMALQGIELILNTVWEKLDSMCSRSPSHMLIQA